MATYMTKQRKTIFDFLRNNLHRQFTVKQMLDSLVGCDNGLKGRQDKKDKPDTKNTKLSLSTLYRSLKYLEKEGYIKCSLKNTELGNEVLYQYINKENCNSHIHAICTLCDTTFHLEQSQEQIINNSLLDNNGFFVDNNKTVIYGACANCHQAGL